MTRKFIAAIVGAALAITVIGSAPARADEDLAKALAAIVGIAIVGKVIKDKIDDDRDERRKVSRARDDGRYEFVKPRASRADPVIRGFEPRPLPRRVERRLLPGDCLRSYVASDRRYRVFGKRCLENNYSYAGSLPRACEVKFRANGKKRRGYDARCLRNEGYQLARR